MTKSQIAAERRVYNVAAIGAIGTLLAWLSLSTDAEVRTGTPASTREQSTAAAPLDLESAFWRCDYAGTNGSVDAGTAIACSAVTEELKNRKFNGDFDALVAWWRENKPAEHQALQAAGLANTVAVARPSGM